MTDEKHITPEQAEKLIAWLKEKAPHGIKCSVCGVNDWQIAPDIVTPLRLTDGAVSIGGSMYPLVMLICRNCAHTIFLNAILSGVMDRPKVADEKAGDQNVAS